MLYKPLQRNITVFALVNATSSFSMFHPILALYLAQRLGSVFAVTLIYSAITFGSAVLEIPTGVIADRFGRRLSVILSHFADMIAVVMLAFGQSTLHFVFYAAAVAFASALSSGASDALLYDTLLALGRHGEYQKISGRNGAIGTVAVAIAGLVGGICATYSLRLPVLLSIVPFLGSACLSLLFVEPLRERREPENESHARAALRLIIGQKPLLIFAALLLVFDLTMEPVYQLSQIFLRQNGIPVAMFGAITCIVMALRSCAALYGYVLAERIGKRPTLFLAMTLSSVLTWTATLLSGWTAAAALILVYTLFGILHPLMSHILNGYLHSRSRATALSIINLASSLGLSVMIPLMGYLSDHAGIRTAYRICAASLIVIVALQNLPGKKSLRPEAA